MASIFDFLSYREYLTSWIDSQKDRKYGIKGRIATQIGASSSLVSQILKGEKSLTPDQTSDLSDFMGLSELEGEQLHLLVDWDRAGTRRFKEKLMKRILENQERSKKIGARVLRNKELSDEQKSVYYSSWLYTAIRNIAALNDVLSVQDISDYIDVDAGTLNKVIQFLLENQLCIEKEGAITYGPASTHIDRESDYVNIHHRNWRLKAIERMEKREGGDVFFTSPMSLSHKAIAEIEKRIPNFIQEIMKVVGPSKSEEVACLNIDWFRY